MKLSVANLQVLCSKIKFVGAVKHGMGKGKQELVKAIYGHLEVF